MRKWGNRLAVFAHVIGWLALFAYAFITDSQLLIFFLSLTFAGEVRMFIVELGR